MHVLVTAGPTRERIDPVRFISNRSSGRMGFAVAAAALERGHTVTLITGPVALASPERARLVRVESAADMLRAVEAHFARADALVMAAAVADWRPARVHDAKQKKTGVPAVLPLEPTVDILQRVAPAKGRRLVIGFAAETGDPRAEAHRKLKTKGLDLIVANDVSRSDAGFDLDTNVVTVIDAAGHAEDWPSMPKLEVARRLITWLETHASPQFNSA